MRKTWVLFLNEMRLVSRDKKSLLLLFLMPALLVLSLSAILNNLYSNQKPSLNIAIISPIKTGVSEQIHNSLKDSQKTVQLLTNAPRDLKNNFDVAIFIPTNLSEALRGSPQHANKKIEFVFYKFLDPFQKTFLMNEFVRLLQAEIIKEINTEIKSQGENKDLNISDPSQLVVETKTSDSKDLSPLTFSLSAWSLFAIFFIVIPFSNSFYRDWNNDILLRLKSLQLSKAQVLGSRVLAYIVINFLQFGFLLFLGSFLLPLLLNTPYTIYLTAIPKLLTVTLSASLAASAYALLISCFSKTQEQASSLGAFGVVIMSLLGGVMIPTLFMPEFMAKYISIFSPLYWGLEGLAEAFQRDSNLFILGRSIMALLLFALCFYLVSLSTFRWSKR